MRSRIRRATSESWVRKSKQFGNNARCCYHSRWLYSGYDASRCRCNSYVGRLVHLPQAPALLPHLVGAQCGCGPYCSCLILCSCVCICRRVGHDLKP